MEVICSSRPLPLNESDVLGAIRHAAVAATSFTATGLVHALARKRETETRFVP